jgi:OmpA-OmpF porin, OOP family
MRRNGRIAVNLAMGFLTCVSVFAAGVQTRGMIISRNGETFIVDGPNGKTTVVLTEATTTKDDRGLFGLEKEHLGATVLIPGLKVKVDGSPDGQGRVVANTITVDGDDLETAEMIQAGLHPTAEQVAANMQAIEVNRQHIAGTKQLVSANQQNIAANQHNIAANKQQIEMNIKDIEGHTARFNALSDYDVRGEETIKFGSGSSRISPADQAKLKNLAQSATGLKGYIVEVTGYADATGGAEMNTKLSEARAKSVIIFLTQQGNIPVRHIVAPGAMGEYGSSAANETKAGRAENRRAVVKVLVNKGVSGT